MVRDGVEALAYLRGEGSFAGEPRPDLVLLDLNMPRKDGRAVLAEMKADPALKSIPVIVLTTSTAQRDVLDCYRLQAACYIAKPVQFDDFISVVEAIESFWFRVVTFPTA